MRPMILRIALAVLLAVITATASARPGLGAGEAVYLVVLTDAATEPDIAALGGRILESHSGQRLAVLPPSGVEALRHHAGVAYVQRIWTGEPGEPAVSAQQVLPEVASAAAAPPWTTGAYAYDPSGNVKSMGQDTFGYDRVGRLIQSRVSGQSQTFTYDHYGNLTKLGTRTITLDDLDNNRLEGAGISYDPIGNMTADGGGRTYHYDPLGMVTGIDMTGAGTVGNTRMIYTADDERIVIFEPSVTRYRVRDFSGRVLREWKSSGSVLQWERDYLYAGGDLVAGEVQVDQRLNGMRHYHKDHLGSTRMVTDGARELVSRQDYLPFGIELTSTTAEFDNTGKAPRDPKKFTGHERDYFTLANAEGEYIDYMHARYYAAGWGRFLSVDPAPDSVWLQVPQSWNRYSYALNNPFRYTDPTGLEPCQMTLPDGTETDGECIDVEAEADPVEEVPDETAAQIAAIQAGQDMARFQMSAIVDGLIPEPVKGAGSYFRGIYRGANLIADASGARGDCRQERVGNEAFLVFMAVALGNKPMMVDVAKEAIGRNKGYIAGRLATGAGVTFLLSRAGGSVGARVGMGLGVLAMAGDASHSLGEIADETFGNPCVAKSF